MGLYKLGDDFLLGTATSSVQIEGGDKNNTWYRWCEEGRISDLSSCLTACDHWNRVEEDTELLKELKVQTHRLSLEWSRIEPWPEVFSVEAVQHYREEILLLLNNNIKPLVTLHHFSEPNWFLERGGWLEPDNARLFIDYVRYVIENLGDLVSEWVTFNEPNVYANLGYVVGIFPPGWNNLCAFFQVSSQLIKTHLELYELIHQIRAEKGFDGKTKVGYAMHIRIFDAFTILGKAAAAGVDYFFHRIFLEGMTSGKLLFPLARADLKYKQARYVDFLGINYYTRNIVEFVLSPTNRFHRCLGDKSLTKSDLGWDIYPEGIYRVCKKYYTRYKLPIYITENGISDSCDDRRPAFITNHLAYLVQAMEEGIPVERYYHWSIMDNFEWLEGESARFGLYHCDFRTQTRTARPSAELYTEICCRKEFESINS